MDSQTDFGVTVLCFQDLYSGCGCRVAVMAEEFSQFFQASHLSLSPDRSFIVYGDLAADPRFLFPAISVFLLLL
jgi:hypothetical protein